jgi:hypothetical protein
MAIDFKVTLCFTLSLSKPNHIVCSFLVFVIMPRTLLHYRDRECLFAADCVADLKRLTTNLKRRLKNAKEDNYTAGGYFAGAD